MALNFLLCAVLVGVIGATSVVTAQDGYFLRDPTFDAATQYMKTLYEQHAMDDLSSIQCYADTDVMAGNYRATPQSDFDCTTLTRYRFSVGSLLNVESIEKALLRAYLQVPSNVALTDGNTNDPQDIPLPPNKAFSGGTNRRTVVVTMRLHDEERNATTEYVHARAYEVTLTEESGDWMEMDVTRGFQNLPQFQAGEKTQVEFILSLHTDCQDEKTKGTQAYFVDPAAYRSPVARKHYSNLQPLLIIYSKEHTPVSLLPEGGYSNPPITKRQSSSRSWFFGSQCERQEFLVNFHADLGLDYIIQPRSIDIGKCRGFCYNYHSLLLGFLQERQGGSGFEGEDLGYWGYGCFPTEFQSVEVLLRVNGVLIIDELHNVIVTDCACSCGASY